MAFEPYRSAAALKFIANFAQRLSWTGQISFDFRHAADGSLHVIECNPRATSGVHFFLSGDRLADAILGKGPAVASGSAAMTLPLAMLVYGLPRAFGNDGFDQWLTDLRSMTDISRWPGDRGMLGPQLRALAEIGFRSMESRCSLIDASVKDIEWDGQALT